MFKMDTSSLFRIVSNGRASVLMLCILTNYLLDKAGDRISIFGFSRGAYTARALAGMIQRVGLLPADNTQQIPFAWSMYVRGKCLASFCKLNYCNNFSQRMRMQRKTVPNTNEPSQHT